MTSILTPRWNPLALPASGPATSELFDPVIVTERGVIVVGGASAIHVAHILDRQAVWFTIPAQTGFSGFAVSATSLYVQDGPVISGWDLTVGTRFASTSLATLNRWVRSENANDSESPPASLYAVPASSTAVTYSAPMVRGVQLDSNPEARVFVLSTDGLVHALGADLGYFGACAHDVPLRAQFALAEIPQAGDVLACHVYYVKADGGIAGLDATVLPMEPLDGWEKRGTVTAAKVLPLQYHDGLLWGGGILDADFFAATLDPVQPLVLTVAAPAAGWKTYEIAASDRLALVSNGTTTRLVSYDRNARLRDRWRERVASTPSHTIFWSGTGSDAAPATPRLVLDVAKVGASDTTAASFAVLLANTVDATHPALTPAYPPVPTPLDTGTFGPGAFTALPRMAVFRCRPIVVRNALYAVVRSAATGGAEALVSFGLNTEKTTVQVAAKASLDQLALQAQPIRLNVRRTDDLKVTDVPPRGTYRRGPYALPGGRVTLKAGSEKIVVSVEDNGVVFLNTQLAGRDATIELSSIAGPVVSCTSARLQINQPATIDVKTEAGSRFPPQGSDWHMVR